MKVVAITQDRTIAELWNNAEIATPSPLIQEILAALVILGGVTITSTDRLMKL